MSRLRKPDQILQGKGYMKGSSIGAWNPKYGAQQGYGPNFKQIVSNQAHVQRNLVCVLLQAPQIFNYLEHGELYIETLKSIMETHSMSISGFQRSLEVDTEDHGVGGDGARQQEPINVTRQQPTPEHTFVDKVGRPIQHFFEWWIRYLIMDPHAKMPLIAALDDDRITDMGMDMYSMTCLYFVPDILFRNVDKAWISTNMYPLSSGEDSAGRNLQDSLQLSNLSITFAAVSQTGPGPEMLAQKVMRGMSILDADPFHREAMVDDIDSDVVAAGDSDYKHSMEDTGAEAVLSYRPNTAAVPHI